VYFIRFKCKKCPLTVSKIMWSISGLDVISPSSDLDLISVLYRVNRRWVFIEFRVNVSFSGFKSNLCPVFGLEIII